MNRKIDGSKLHIIPDYNNLSESIMLAGSYGMHFEYNDFFNPDFLDNRALVDDRIIHYLNAEGMPVANTLHGAFLDVTIFSSDRVIREHSRFRLEESMKIADRLNCKAVIIHTNSIPNFSDETYQNSWVSMNEEFIRELLAKYPGIEIYMENMFDISPYLLARLAEKMKDESRFGICLDYAHAHVFGKVPVDEWIESLKDSVRHIHINDNDGINDLHLALGDGIIDYDYFMDIYARYFSDATVLLEVNGIEKIRKSLGIVFAK